MPRGLHFAIDVIGSGPFVSKLDRIRGRMENLEDVFEKAFRIWEAGEARHFGGLGGRYVRTGALRDSLTQPNANGAIREAHAQEAVFGSSVFYAKFQRRNKKSAVLVLKPTERKLIAKTMIREILQ
jgi:hypothetical protein